MYIRDSQILHVLDMMLLLQMQTFLPPPWEAVVRQPVFACLFVSKSNNLKSYLQMLMPFTVNVDNGPRYR